MSWIWLGLAGYLLVLLLLFIAQRSLLYPASKEVPDLASAPGFEEIQTRNGDGERLVHWFRPPATSEAPLVVLFQGNAGHIGHRVGKYDALIEAGFGLALTGYRGYGGNPGRPSEVGLLDDARSFLAWLAAEDYAPVRTVLYGESLGTGVAVALAAEGAARADTPGGSAEPRRYAGVVLEAPFTSVADAAQATYWFVPAKWLVKDRWDSLRRIDRVATPLLVVMGERDEVIPPAQGRRLFAAAREPKQALFVPEAGHNDLYEFPVVRERVTGFIRRVAAGETSVAAD